MFSYSEKTCLHMCLMFCLRATTRVCMSFFFNHCGCVLQEKPAPPPCGTTTPGCISMTTPQRENLPSSSRTSSMPCSPMPASLSCSGTRWKGEGDFPPHWMCALNMKLLLKTSPGVTVYTVDTVRYFLGLWKTKAVFSWGLG